MGCVKYGHAGQNPKFFAHVIYGWSLTGLEEGGGPAEEVATVGHNILVYVGGEELGNLGLDWDVVQVTGVASECRVGL